MKKKILLIYDRDLMPFTFFRRQEMNVYKFDAKQQKNRQLTDDKDDAKRQSKNFVSRHFK